MQPATFFAPQLYIPNGIKDISFYEKAFGAVLLRSFLNEDGSYHVAELAINGAVFQLHEQKTEAGAFSPAHINGTSVLIGLFVKEVEAMAAQAIAAGATMVSPPQRYDYGYQQCIVQDPFGHNWMIETKI